MPCALLTHLRTALSSHLRVCSFLSSIKTNKQTCCNELGIGSYSTIHYFGLTVFCIFDPFVELGGGVDDALVWRRDGAYVEFGFR